MYYSCPTTEFGVSSARAAERWLPQVTGNLWKPPLPPPGRWERQTRSSDSWTSPSSHPYISRTRIPRAHMITSGSKCQAGISSAKDNILARTTPLLGRVLFPVGRSSRPGRRSGRAGGAAGWAAERPAWPGKRPAGQAERPAWRAERPARRAERPAGRGEGPAGRAERRPAGRTER
eukprot:gene8488-biopygen16633